LCFFVANPSARLVAGKSFVKKTAVRFSAGTLLEPRGQLTLPAISMKTTKLMHALLVMMLCAGINVGTTVREFNPPESSAQSVDLRLAGQV
jgi:hypothetical protein